MAEQPKPGRLSTDKFIQSFSGEGDVVAWIAKIELVAKLTNVPDVSSFISLYLEGGALALYLELPEAKKADPSHKEGVGQSINGRGSCILL